MSAIATVLARMGHAVTGSDLKESRGLERLGVPRRRRRRRAPRRERAADVDAVVVSTAIPDSNPEVVAAVERGMPGAAPRRRAARHRRDAPTVAVAGSHGKTTTSSMLALILRAAGWHPSFIIGGDLNEVGTNAAYDDGEWLVVEADESDGTFLELGPRPPSSPTSSPTTSTTTAASPAHRAFDQFVAGIPGVRVCADDPRSPPLARRAARRATTYGFAEDADYRIVDYEGDRDGTRSPSSTERACARRHRPAGPRAPQRRQRDRRRRLALELGAVRAAVDALRGFGGVAAASSSAARSTGSRSSTTTRTSPARSPR